MPKARPALDFFLPKDSSSSQYASENSLAKKIKKARKKACISKDKKLNFSCMPPRTKFVTAVNEVSAEKMKKESLTRRFLAEMLSPESGNGTYEPTRTKRKEDRPGKSSARDEVEQKLRHSINFGSGFYSIAEAAIITNRSKNAIRQMLQEGKLTKLSFPNTSREFISGIDLTDVVVQHNLERILGKKE